MGTCMVIQIIIKGIWIFDIIYFIEDISNGKTSGDNDHGDKVPTAICNIMAFGTR